MTKANVIPLTAFLLCSALAGLTGLCAETPVPDPADAEADASIIEMAASPDTEAPPRDEAAGLPDPSSDVVKTRFKLPAPLKRLTFSAKEGFSLRMISNQDVTAEIRNGAGRTLARNAYTLEAGDWTLRPRNLPPGLYTVLLRTGAQLRSMRMKIDGSERGKGSPEWVLEKVPDSTHVTVPAEQRGASASAFSPPR